MDRIDETIKSNIQPCLVSLQEGMTSHQLSLQPAVLDTTPAHPTLPVETSGFCCRQHGSRLRHLRQLLLVPMQKSVHGSHMHSASPL
jgi:hypothetical protein